MSIKLTSLFSRMRILFFLLHIVICSSCYQDVMDIDLSATAPQIVIEGVITDQPGDCTVIIQKTGDYYHPDTFPPVSGALVEITDNENHSVILREFSAGVYRTHSLQGVPGRTYTLNISVENEMYTAVSTMPGAIALDSLSYLAYDMLTYYFTDRPGTDDYCRTKIYLNGILDEDAFYLYNGRFTDGEQIEVSEYLDFYGLGILNFQYNPSVRVELLTLDKPIFEYFSMLYDEYTSLDLELPDFIETTSFNPTTNLSNNALGYFSAHTIRSYSFFVE